VAHAPNLPQQVRQNQPAEAGATLIANAARLNTPTTKSFLMAGWFLNRPGRTAFATILVAGARP